MTVIKKYLKDIFLVFAVYAFPVIFMYAQNKNELSSLNLLFPLAIYLLIGALTFALFALALKKSATAAICTALAGLLLLNYSLMEKIFVRMHLPLYVWHYIALILLFVYLFGLYMRQNPTASTVVSTVLSLCFGSLLVINLVISIPSFFNKAFVPMVDVNQIKLEKKSNSENIYYLLFDEFSSFVQMKTYVGHDIDYFKNELEQLGFTVSESSKNESFYTLSVITNFVNLAYVTNENGNAAYQEIMRIDSPLLQLLKKSGYNITNMGETSDKWLGDGLKQNTFKAVTHDGRTMEELLLQTTVFLDAHAIKPPIKVLDATTTKSYEQRLGYLDQLDTLCQVPNTSQFVFYYTCTPHYPFVFDEKGNPPISGNEYLVTNESYANQVKYVASRIKSACEKIIASDPSATIIVTSDHGFRQEPNGLSAQQWVINRNNPPEIMRGILNAVYYKGEKIDEINGQSAVNTLRIVLNKMIGTDFDILLVPNNDASYEVK